MPFLGKDRDSLALRCCRPDDVIGNKPRHAIVEIAHLEVLTVVDPVRVASTDPLGPPVEVEVSVELHLMPR